LIVITLILVAFFVLWNYMDKKNQSTDPTMKAKESVQSVSPKKVTPSQSKDNTSIMKDVLTNLADKGKIVKATFAFELDNKKGKDEFDLLDFKVKSIVNSTLIDMSSEQLNGSKGQDNLTSALMNKINPMLTEGKIKQIWITDWIIQ
jgi:flagellar FliL protein